MEGFSGNYTGPYWSDGKLQESVEFGTEDPKSELDYLSRLHDTAYAHYKDDAHREAADEIYERDAKRLVGRFPHLAGDLVLHGNRTSRAAKRLAGDVGKFSMLGPMGALLGAAKFQIGNMITSHKMIKGTHLAKEKADIQALYDRDPQKGKWSELSSAYNKPPLKRSIRMDRVSVKPAPPQAGETKPAHDQAPETGRREGETHRKTKVAPAPPAPKNVENLVANQAKRLQHYRNLHAAAIGPHPAAAYKRKKKKGNVRAAVVIDPYLHLR